MQSLWSWGTSRPTPQLIVFDKDGTLIDFHAMWGTWIIELAYRLEVAVARPLTDRLFDLFGFDPLSGQVAPDGPLAIASMAELRDLATALLLQIGLTPASAQAAITSAWYIPDPVALARPLADLPALFGQLHHIGIRIAIATTDDRAPTTQTIAELGIVPFVVALSCGDDGTARKPAPDMVLQLCKICDVAPIDTAVVGDTLADLRMGRAAGVGTVIGVLSGVGTQDALAPLADILLPSVGELLMD